MTINDLNIVQTLLIVPDALCCVISNTFKIYLDNGTIRI
ncbi:hypothetical protein FHS68_000223 [Dyadobacter arcticus]|uniref:Uncharacterized protein n=1 Tax=Dyadobacter arcticus TaxID=1078754 RepID=A0ABX0UEI7_9BACT|nr:hypothetical protein [Dyadobacter arcticus]